MLKCAKCGGPITLYSPHACRTRVEAKTEQKASKTGGAKAPSHGFMEFLRIKQVKPEYWIASLVDGPWEEGKTKEEALYKLVMANQAWFSLEGVEVVRK